MYTIKALTVSPVGGYYNVSKILVVRIAFSANAQVALGRFFILSKGKHHPVKNTEWRFLFYSIIRKKR